MSEHGIFTMSAEQYRAADGLNFSLLKILREKSPAHLKDHLDGNKPEPTEAMKFGSLLHSCLLEPESAEFHVKPEGMKFTTKDGIAWRDEHQDKPIITEDQHNSIKRMIDGLYSHPMAKRLLSGGKPEQSLFSRDASGLMRKCRIDYLPERGNVIVDVKTCEDASPEGFGKQTANLFYLGQAYYYLKLCELCGLEKSAFVFIAVEKTSPYAIAIYRPQIDYIEAAGKLIEVDVQTYRNCIESGKWPAYGDDIKDLILPAWAEKQLPLQHAA